MSSRIKLLLVILLPILVGSALVTATVWLGAREALDERTRHFGNAIVDQLAVTVTDPLLQGDVLSLNVMLNELEKRGDVSFATVYDADDRLRAQAGRATEGLTYFSRDVTFQNTKTGYVQLGLDLEGMRTSLATIAGTAAGLCAAITALLALALWRYGDIVYLWLSPDLHRHRRKTAAASLPADHVEPEEDVDATPGTDTTERTLLVLKIQPVRLLDEHEDTIIKALALYGGHVGMTDGDDIVATFERSDQILKASSAATLVKALMERARGRITVKAGLHVVDEDADDAELGKHRKQVTYLASIADERILASRRAFERSQGNERLVFEPFHSSLTPEGEAYFLAHMHASSRALIDQQADQLALRKIR